MGWGRDLITFREMAKEMLTHLSGWSKYLLVKILDVRIIHRLVTLIV